MNNIEITLNEKGGTITFPISEWNTIMEMFGLYNGVKEGLLTIGCDVQSESTSCSIISHAPGETPTTIFNVTALSPEVALKVVKDALAYEKPTLKAGSNFEVAEDGTVSVKPE